MSRRINKWEGRCLWIAAQWLCRDSSYRERAILRWTLQLSRSCLARYLSRRSDVAFPSFLSIQQWIWLQGATYRRCLCRISWTRAWPLLFHPSRNLKASTSYRAGSVWSCKSITCRWVKKAQSLSVATPQVIKVREPKLSAMITHIVSTLDTLWQYLNSKITIRVPSRTGLQPLHSPIKRRHISMTKRSVASEKLSTSLISASSLQSLKWTWETIVSMETSSKLSDSVTAICDLAWI